MNISGKPEGESGALSPAHPPTSRQGDHDRGAPLLEGYNNVADDANPTHHGRRDDLIESLTRGVDVQALWIWEALSFSAAIALYGVFFYLLFRYDNQLVTSWEEDNPNISGLFKTLPSMVSFITTLMRGFILFPVASAIGQWKWHYLRRTRRLLSMELMDGASRGYWGAARLLLSKDCL